MIQLRRTAASIIVSSVCTYACVKFDRRTLTSQARHPKDLSSSPSRSSYIGTLIRIVYAGKLKMKIVLKDGLIHLPATHLSCFTIIILLELQADAQLATQYNSR